jgi:hypothetical protein
MIETKIVYGSYEQSIWAFAELELSIQNAVDQMTASFTESEKRKKVGKLIETLQVIEGDLILSQSASGLKEKVHHFFNDKTFGTIEQMRIELELRYKAEVVWL